MIMRRWAVLEFLKDILSVRKTHDELEMQFAERTAELSRTNELLRQEINERKRVEESIKGSLAQLSRKNRYETIIGTVTRSVHQSIDLQEVLENAADAMYTNIEGVDHIAMYLVEGEEAVLRAHKNFPDWYIKRAGRIPYSKGLVWKTILEGQPIYCGDVDNDTLIGPAGRGVGMKSYLSVPVRFEGKTVGITGISSFRKNAFDQGELKLLENVAQQIETAINNAQQAERLRRSEEEIRKLNEGLERRVIERTAKLEATNRELQKEIIIRKKAEDALTNSLTGLAKKNRYETIIGAVTRSVHQSINLQSVLEHAVDAIKRNVDGADLVGIYLVEEEEAVMKVHRGFTDQFIERAGRIPYPKGFTWKTIIEDKPLYCPDVNADTAIGPAGRDEGIKSYLSMPIHYDDKALGSIHINSFEENAFDENELILLGIIVRQIEVAINNARQAEELKKAQYGLEIKVQERTADLLTANEKLRREIIERARAEERLTETAERLQALSQRIADVQEAERRRLVEVLHDHIGQNLTALSINLNIIGTILSPESAEKVKTRLEDSLHLVEETTVRTRDIMVELYPPVLNDYGLLATLRWFGEETTARTGLEVITAGEEPIPRLPREMEIALFRIVQEAVNNILKHASAKRVKIELESTPVLVRLTVSDDGVGFDPVSIVADRVRQSWGLLIMHGRADALGGRLRLNSCRGRGTDVIVEVGR
jgi:signal transduction histidine kinase